LPDWGVSDGNLSEGGDIGRVSCLGGDSSITLVLGFDKGPGAEGSNGNMVGCMRKESEDKFWPLSHTRNSIADLHLSGRSPSKGPESKSFEWEMHGATVMVPADGRGAQIGTSYQL